MCGNSDVFHGVVLVHIEIALGSQVEIESAVMREEFQHVIEEADAGRDVIASAAIDRKRGANLRLSGIALDDGFSHRANASLMRVSSSVSRNAVSRRSV